MEGTDSIYLRTADLLKALPHRGRLRIQPGLPHSRCRNVGCMEANTGQSQSCISQHLMRLKAAGIVKAARSGNEVYYEVSDPQTAAVIAALFGECEEEYHCTTSQ